MLRLTKLLASLSIHRVCRTILHSYRPSFLTYPCTEGVQVFVRVSMCMVRRDRESYFIQTPLCQQETAGTKLSDIVSVDVFVSVCMSPHRPLHSFSMGEYIFTIPARIKVIREELENLDLDKLSPGPPMEVTGH